MHHICVNMGDKHVLSYCKVTLNSNQQQQHMHSCSLRIYDYNPSCLHLWTSSHLHKKRHINNGIKHN